MMSDRDRLVKLFNSLATSSALRYTTFLSILALAGASRSSSDIIAQVPYM